MPASSHAPRWTEAIELGVIAFLAHGEADDDDAVQDWLEALGVQPWLAAHLVTWLPVAFGRQLLRGARAATSTTKPS